MGTCASHACCCTWRSQPADSGYRPLKTGGAGTLPAKAGAADTPTSASISPYTPPSEAHVLAAARLQRRAPGLFDFSGLAFTSPRQDGYPPPFFKRLDQYIKQNGYRARDVFLVLDHDSDRSITTDEMISGLRRIDFDLSKREEVTLRDWMHHVVGHDLSFKEFALALKQRTSLTSPQKLSVLRQLVQP